MASGYRGPTENVDAEARTWFDGLNPLAQELVTEQIKELGRNPRFKRKGLSEGGFLQLLYRLYTYLLSSKTNWPKKPQ